MDPLIINLCPTGMIPTKMQNPHLPVTPKEIIKSTLTCAKLGASIVHIHPRDKFGKPTWKKEVFAKIISGIREKNKEIIINVTTSGRNWSEFEKRSECLELEGDLKPDLASLTVGSLNFINQESVNNPFIIERLAVKMKKNRIKPELEIFEPGMLHKAKHLIKKGILEENPYINLFLGSLGTSPFEPSVFAALHSIMPIKAIWSMAGIGLFQLDTNIMSMSWGGHVRVGLEDNIFFDREKKELASNEKLVERVVKIAQLMKRKIATPKEARKILGLK